MRLLKLAAAAALLLTAAPAFADDYLYKPDGCEFQMKFPEAPYASRRCNPDVPDKCEQKDTYTKVFDSGVTINFYVSCTPLEDGAFGAYDRDVLKSMLIAMAGHDKIERFETAFDEDKDVKRASLLGAGQSYNQNHPVLYMGEFWVGQKSLLTVEGELIGESAPDTDAEFAKILKGVTTTKWAEEDAKKAAETKDKDGSKDKEKDGKDKKKK
jgi:hypothetical protein